MSRFHLALTAVTMLRKRDSRPLSPNSPIVAMNPSKEFIHLSL
jgi:hypothetical protein